MRNQGSGVEKVTYLLLFGEFFVTGLFAFGGGLATLPFLYSMGERTGWFTSAEVMDMLAVSESTPGPIGVNMATYAGFSKGGIPGAAIATIGLVAPSIIVILIIAKLLSGFREQPLVENAFYGLRPASVAMIAAAWFGICGETIFNWEFFLTTLNFSDLFNIKAILIAAALFAAIRLTDKHPIIYIAASAVVGIVFKIS